MQIAEKYKGDKNFLIQNLSKEEEFDNDNKEEEDEEADESEAGGELGNKPIRYFEIEILPESSLGINLD